MWGKKFGGWGGGVGGCLSAKIAQIKHVRVSIHNTRYLVSFNLCFCTLIGKGLVLNVVTLTVTTITDFIHPSGKLKLSFDLNIHQRTTKN